MARPHRTTVMKGEQASRAVSSEFGKVRLHRTSLNHCDVGGRVNSYFVHSIVTWRILKAIGAALKGSGLRG